MSQKENKSNFIIQGAILGVAAIVVRFLGLIYQMPLTRIIGDLGNGYYGYAYNVYSMVLLISSFSIPIAVSKMVSARIAQRQFKNVQRVFKASLIYVMIVAGFVSVLTFIFAGHLLPQSQKGAVPALRVLCPVIFLSGILGVFRGYFQGFNTMVPTSFSQILEGILNAVISVLAAYILVIPYAAGSVKHATYGAMGSTIGTAAGVVVGLLFMVFVYMAYKPSIRKHVKHDKHHRLEQYPELFKIIFFTVTPVILSSAIYNICPIIDQTIFAGILQKKQIVSENISILYGIYSAKYLKLVSVPVSVASALSSAIIPAITMSMMESNTKDANKKINMAMRFTMLIAMPSTLGMIVLARPILLLFGKQTTLIVAVHILMVGAVNIIFNCISTLTNAVLQGLGNMRRPVIHAVIALVVHIAVCIALLNLNFGIYAMLIGTTVFSLVMWVLNAIAIRQETGYRRVLGSGWLRITFAALEMAFVTWCVYQGLYLITNNSFLCLIIALVAAVVSYLLFLFLANALTEEDYDNMPFGIRIRNLGLRLHLIETKSQPFEEELGEIYVEEEEKQPKKQFIFRKQEDGDKLSEENNIKEAEKEAVNSTKFTRKDMETIQSILAEQEREKEQETEEKPTENTESTRPKTEPINVYEILNKLKEQQQEAQRQKEDAAKEHQQVLEQSEQGNAHIDEPEQ